MAKAKTKSRSQSAFTGARNEIATEGLGEDSGAPCAGSQKAQKWSPIYRHTPAYRGTRSAPGERSTVVSPVALNCQQRAAAPRQCLAAMPQTSLAGIFPGRRSAALQGIQSPGVGSSRRCAYPSSGQRQVARLPATLPRSRGPGKGTDSHGFGEFWKYRECPSQRKRENCATLSSGEVSQRLCPKAAGRALTPSRRHLEWHVYTLGTDLPDCPEPPTPSVVPCQRRGAGASSGTVVWAAVGAQVLHRR